jgi:GTP cyclohydrolase II
MSRSNRPDHIRLTSHPDPGGKLRFPIKWGAATARERGPVIGTVSRPGDRNVIGSHGGSYALYRALAVSSGALDPIRRPDLTNTYPAATIGPFEQWCDPRKIVSLDPWGHLAADSFKTEIAEGIDIRPSIAITKARLDLHEMQQAVALGRLKADGDIIHENGSVGVTKIAIDPVWYLPGIAERFNTPETNLRRALFEQTAGMFPELVTRPDLQVFLPPIGGTTVYMFGDVTKLPDHTTKITCRVHDECNGSDVFGSDICTCRPYLIHGIEECARAAQDGGLGIIVYNRKEGRALGEVTKFLVYNARKRQEGGDAAASYFERTECVAGVQDARFQQLMPDCINWLGLKRIDRFVSMSDMKYGALVSQGVEIVERVPIPDYLVPSDAQVEIAAKKAAGYYSSEEPKPQDLKDTVGRALDKY